ncbi:FadD3 family acyl-CoA ligase [Streptomyces thermolineatus]|uniref:FadD3 family acyl-CoA ligase n=1 Tax=Streptomyces thermolineatus TaxID=44033 RepID=UPI00384CA87E
MSDGEQATTVPGVLAAAAAGRPEAEALVDGPVRLTYRQLREEVRRAAAATIASGVGPGERVAVWAPNGHRWVIAALGALAAGAVLVPVNTRYKGEEAAWLLERSGARLLLVANGFLGHDYLAMLDRAGSLPELRRTVVLTDDKKWNEFLESGEAVPAGVLDARTAAVGPDDISDMLFTSGTTGRPKGALTAHAQNVRAAGAWSSRAGLRPEDRYLVVNPLFHTFGWKAGVIACLTRGATVVLQQVFDADETLRLVGRERITVLPGPPTVYTSLLDHPDRAAHDLSSLRVAVTGAAVVPVALVERMQAELCPEVLTAYGLTESCGMVSMCTAEDSPETIARTAGRAVDGIELAVADPSGRHLGPGEPGEIVVRGYNVMRGYHDDPAATAEALDADGWLHTGDVGHLDEQGNLTITDRLKDMFVVGGFNVYPAEVEQLLARHPGISEAAVVGVPDARMGEVGRAYVTPRPGADVDPDEVVAFVRARLANFKVPREVVVLDRLPRNAAGKVVKNGLRTA